MDSIRSSALYCVLLLALSQLTVSNQHPLSPATPLSIPGVIPGESNLKFCPESRDTDLLQIDRVEVDPTPPLVEENLDIYIYGFFLKNISDHPVWNWYARENSTDNPGRSGTVPFCGMVDTIDQPYPGREKDCPPLKGFAILSLHAYVPWFVGEGNFTVKFDAMTKEGERIYCLDGEFELKYPEGKS